MLAAVSLLALVAGKTRMLNVMSRTGSTNVVDADLVRLDQILHGQGGVVVVPTRGTSSKNT